jgi:hypothetical protein
MVPFHRSVPRLAKLLMPREIEEMTSRLEDHSGGMQMPTAWQSAHGLARQITGRHERGLQTARAASRLKLLLDMTNTLVSHLDLRDLLRANSASIRQDMHCDVVGCGCRMGSSVNCANSLWTSRKVRDLLRRIRCTLSRGP